jgi:hypothetical protein
MNGATSNQISELNTVTDVMMNGEFRMKSSGSVTGNTPERVFSNAKTMSTAKASHGNGRRN